MDKHGLLEIHPIVLCIVFDLDGVRCGKKVIKSRKLKGNYLVEKRSACSLFDFIFHYVPLCSFFFLRALSIKRLEWKERSKGDGEGKRKILGSFSRNDYAYV